MPFKLFLCLVLPLSAWAQEARFSELANKYETGSKQEIGQLMVVLGKGWLDVPYTGKTLEVDGPEQLVVNLETFDCFTMVENSLALARTFADGGDYQSFRQALKALRYRDQTIVDYASRLHYTSDWGYENQNQGFIKDITRELDGELDTRVIDFMSKHRDAYRQLADNTQYARIQDIEKKINQRQRYILPESKLPAQEKHIREGDILAMVSSVKGLDIAHVGLATFVKGRLHLLHASSKSKKVIISAEPLADVLKQRKSWTGLMVFRPQQP